MDGKTFVTEDKTCLILAFEGKIRMKIGSLTLCILAADQWIQASLSLSRNWTSDCMVLFPDFTLCQRAVPEISAKDHFNLKFLFFYT